MPIKSPWASAYLSAIPLGIIAPLAVFALLCSLFIASPGLKYLEQSNGLHLLFKMRGSKPPPEIVRIVAINAGAGENLQLSRQTVNWPRTVYARLIERLHTANARLIVIDINFKEARSEKEDEALATAIKNSGKVVLVTYLRREQIQTGNGYLDIETEIRPIDRFAEAALTYGPFTVPKLPSEVATSRLIYSLVGGLTEAQPLAAYQALAKLDASFGTLPEIQESIHINYYGPDRTIPTHNIDTVLQESPDMMAQLFAGKVVYIGFSEPAQTEQKDAFRTVFSSHTGVDMSGVEISATVFSNLLERSWIKPSGKTVNSMIAAFFFILAFSTSSTLRARLAVPLQASLFALYIFVALKQFDASNRWLPIMLPLIIIVGVNGIVYYWLYRHHQKKSKHIESTLQNFLPEEAAHKVTRSIIALEQQHNLVSGICLMSDIRGFTRLSEQLDPGELHDLMNRYYALLIDEVKRQNGIVGNLVGDSMLALWTGTELNTSMCEKAIVTAENIEKSLVNAGLHRKLPTGFAIHGGEFSLGNLGAQGHFEYAPVGDIINTTSRIEPINRRLKTSLLCSDTIYRLLSGTTLQSHFRPAGSFDMHNKAKALNLYAQMSARINSEHATKIKQWTARAIESFERSDEDLATEYFNEVLKLHPDDGLTRYYLELMSQ